MRPNVVTARNRLAHLRQNAACINSLPTAIGQARERRGECQPDHELRTRERWSFSRHDGMFTRYIIGRDESVHYCHLEGSIQLSTARSRWYSLPEKALGARSVGNVLSIRAPRSPAHATWQRTRRTKSNSIYSVLFHLGKQRSGNQVWTLQCCLAYAIVLRNDKRQNGAMGVGVNKDTPRWSRRRRRRSIVRFVLLALHRWCPEHSKANAHPPSQHTTNKTKTTSNHTYALPGRTRSVKLLAG